MNIRPVLRPVFQSNQSTSVQIPRIKPMSMDSVRFGCFPELPDQQTVFKILSALGQHYGVKIIENDVKSEAQLWQAYEYDQFRATAKGALLAKQNKWTQHESEVWWCEAKNAIEQQVLDIIQKEYPPATIDMITSLRMNWSNTWDEKYGSMTSDAIMLKQIAEKTNWPNIENIPPHHYFSRLATMSEEDLKTKFDL